MIRLTCPCGRALKAPDKLAGKESRCPACGAAVRVGQVTVTSIVASHGAEAQASVADSSPIYALAAQPSSTFVPTHIAVEVDPNHVRKSVYQRHAFDTLCDPLVGVKFVFQLSGMLAVMAALGVALYPLVLDEGFSWMSGVLLAVVWTGATSLILGYGLQFLDSVLQHAVGGGAGYVEVPDYDPGPALTSLVRWSLCFLSGPAFLLYFAFCFWIHCGDMTALDRLIVAELTIPAVGYGIMGLLVLARRPELALLSPRRVLKAARRLGRRAILATVGVTAGGFVHVGLGILAVMLLYESWLSGLFLLLVCWFSAWQCSAFALRTLGFWEHNRATTGGQRNSPPSRGVGFPTCASNRS